MGAAREPGQADFDLERFIDMFDEALTSQDERVVNALRSLMMMVILTKPETRANERLGPLRQIYDDLNHLNRRMHRMEDEIRALNDRNAYKEKAYQWDDLNKHNLLNTAQMPPLKFDSILSAELAKRINGGKI